MGYRVRKSKNKHKLPTKDGVIADMFEEWFLVFKDPHLQTKSKA